MIVVTGGNDKAGRAVISSAGAATTTRFAHAKFRPLREYGLAAKHYGSALEIDHIVSLELGGSIDIANL